jgi:hypothetical protein
VLLPADWGVSPFQHHAVERQPGVVDGTEDIQIASFEPVQEELGPETTDDTEANEQGPPPELQSGGHVEDLTSFTNSDSDLARMACLQPIPPPDVASTEHSVQSLEYSMSSGASVMAVAHNSYVNLTNSDPPVVPSVSRDLSGAGRAFLSSPSALDPQVHVAQSLDVFQMVSTTPGDADHDALESTSAILESTPARLEHTSEAPVDHSAMTAPPAESFLRTTLPKEQSDFRGPVSLADTTERTHGIFTLLFCYIASVG